MSWSKVCGLGCWQKRWQKADEDDMYLGYKTGFVRIWRVRRKEKSRNPPGFWLFFPGGSETQGKILHLVLNSLTLGAFEAPTGCCLDLGGNDVSKRVVKKKQGGKPFVSPAPDIPPPFPRPPFQSAGWSQPVLQAPPPPPWGWGLVTSAPPPPLFPTRPVSGKTETVK